MTGMEFTMMETGENSKLGMMEAAKKSYGSRRVLGRKNAVSSSPESGASGSVVRHNALARPCWLAFHKNTGRLRVIMLLESRLFTISVSFSWM
ncbi:MAG: hypothetical protein JKY23_00300 [Nitrospinaceae bacterium]|nr:hypothetical protein [Nitrospinaceae bacterium]